MKFDGVGVPHYHRRSDDPIQSILIIYERTLHKRYGFSFRIGPYEVIAIIPRRSPWRTMIDRQTPTPRVLDNCERMTFSEWKVLMKSKMKETPGCLETVSIRFRNRFGLILFQSLNLFMKSQMIQLRFVICFGSSSTNLVW